MDISYTRISTFRQCPKKFEYSYVEELEEKDVKALMLGDIFHRLKYAWYEKPTDVQDVIDEYRDLVMAGKLDTPIELMETIIVLYANHYAKAKAKERVIAAEYEMLIPWEGSDNMVGIADEIVEDDGLNVVRDTKTTSKKLKYTFNLVKYNPQLLLYTGMVEEVFTIKVDAMEIDEVRLAMLEKVPINKNGKPSTAKGKLDLVTYEDYMAVLIDKGLDTAPEYQTTIEYLLDRGHPLFKRNRVQLLDPNVVNENVRDIYGTYRNIVHTLNDNHIPFARSRSVLCGWCGFNELCKLDYYAPTAEERELVIDKSLVRKT